jgi:Uma2 family endonuclease
MYYIMVILAQILSPMDNVPSLAIAKYMSFPEGVNCEVMYGRMFTKAIPNLKHQQVSVRLSARLYKYLDETPKGEILKASCDVYIKEKDAVVQPDIFIIMRENRDIIHEDAIHGVPDVVFEILCGNREYDRVKKKNFYEDCGVKEYFIVDPLDNNVTMFSLNNQKKYELVYELKGKIASEILGMSFDL